MVYSVDGVYIGRNCLFGKAYLGKEDKKFFNLPKINTEN